MTLINGITIATVCARGGSKGLPGKNVKPFPDRNGKPLIVHTIEQALTSGRIQKVYVSTDDEHIAQVARAAGALVPCLRPAALATDEAGKLPAIEHMVRIAENEGHKVETVVDLQPTSPLRIAGDIERCLDSLDGFDLALSVYECGFHPSFNLVKKLSDGTIQLCGQDGAARRQDLPAVYGMNGSIYCWRRQALPAAIAGGLWSLRVNGVVMPPERSADIDDLLDFEWAAWLYQRQSVSGPSPL